MGAASCMAKDGTDRIKLSLCQQGYRGGQGYTRRAHQAACPSSLTTAWGCASVRPAWPTRCATTRGQCKRNNSGKARPSLGWLIGRAKFGRLQAAPLRKGTPSIVDLVDQTRTVAPSAVLPQCPERTLSIRGGRRCTNVSRIARGFVLACSASMCFSRTGLWHAVCCCRHFAAQLPRRMMIVREQKYCIMFVGWRLGPALFPEPREATPNARLSAPVGRQHILAIWGLCWYHFCSFCSFCSFCFVCLLLFIWLLALPVT